MLLGEAIRLWGVGYAGFITRTRNVGADLLVTAGPFARVRNPLYVGNFFISLGACVGLNALMPWSVLVYIVLYAIQYHFIVTLEEETLLGKFGEEYARYKSQVPRFIPSFRPYDNPAAIAFNGQIAFANERKTFTSIFVITLLILAFLHFGNPIAGWITSLFSA